jgi:hypothetical protein
MNEFARRRMEGTLPSKSFDSFVPTDHIEAKPPLTVEAIEDPVIAERDWDAIFANVTEKENPSDLAHADHFDIQGILIEDCRLCQNQIAFERYLHQREVTQFVEEHRNG